jgi:hypothetical protein
MPRAYGTSHACALPLPRTSSGVTRRAGSQWSLFPPLDNLRGQSIIYSSFLLIGKHFGMSQPGHGYDYAIVGVVRNTKYRSPASTPRPMFFLPFTQTTQYAPTGDQRLETGWLYAQSIQLLVAGAGELREFASPSSRQHQPRLVSRQCEELQRADGCPVQIGSKRLTP